MVSPLNPLFAQIAREILFVDTLETRNRDSLDFHDCHVASLVSALEAAYKAGQASVSPLHAAPSLQLAPAPVTVRKVGKRLTRTRAQMTVTK